MPNHFLNFIAFYIAIITGTGYSPERNIYSFGYPRKKVGVIPSFHCLIICRSRMSKAEFEEYLKTHYEYWFSSYYTYLDEKFIEYLIDPARMQELFRIQAMYARQDIALKLKLSEIYQFLITDLHCTTPQQKILVFMQILSSKCFYFSRKSLGRKWKQSFRKKDFLFESLKRCRENIQIQSFFFKMMVDMINNQRNLLQEIQNFDVNKSRMWDTIYVGFEIMSKLFSTGNISDEIVCKEVQHQLCDSTLILCYLFSQDYLLGYKVIRRFYPIQPMYPKFRNFLLGKGNFLFFLVLRLFCQDKTNSLRRIPNSLVTKLMITIGFLPELKRSSHDFKHFLSIQ
jgi:hypothetical protein